MSRIRPELDLIVEVLERAAEHTINLIEVGLGLHQPTSRNPTHRRSAVGVIAAMRVGRSRRISRPPVDFNVMKKAKSLLDTDPVHRLRLAHRSLVPQASRTESAAARAGVRAAVERVVGLARVRPRRSVSTASITTLYASIDIKGGKQTTAS